MSNISTKSQATHYTVTADGITPQMFYRQGLIKWNDGTESRPWQYLSFSRIWMNAELTPRQIKELVKI